MNSMKIGELAKQTGLSVRALHHYDEIALLSPSDRSEGDHRIYNRNDIEKLQKIISLKNVGLSLEEIKNTLSSSPTLETILQKHIEVLEEEISSQEALLHRLQTTLEFSKFQSKDDLETILSSIRDVVTFEKYFKKEQIDELVQNSNDLGEDKVKALINELIQIAHQLKVEKENTTPVDDGNVINLTQRWIDIRNTFTKGKSEFIESAKNMKSDINIMGSMYGIDASLLDYIQKVADHITKQQVL